MASITIAPGSLGARLRADAKRLPRTLQKAAKQAAARGQRHLMQVSKGMGIDDTGLFRNSWIIQEHADGSVTLTNTAPHAGIVEAGARPHPVSQEGRESIEAWVRRKMLQGTPKTDAEVKHIVDGICWKLLHHGQKGHWIVRDAMSLLTSYLNEAINAEIKKGFDE